MTTEKKDFDTPPEGNFPIGMYQGKIDIVTPAQHRAGAMERNAYEALPDDETVAEAEETEKMDDDEIASIRAELEEDDGDEDGEA